MINDIAVYKVIKVSLQIQNNTTEIYFMSIIYIYCNINNGLVDNKTRYLRLFN